MKHIVSYEDDIFSERLLENFYNDVLFEEDNKVSSATKILAGGIGGGLGWAIGDKTIDELKKKGIKIGSAKKFLPFAVAGGLLAGSLVVLKGILNKKKTVNELISNEKDPNKKEAFKKQLNSLSKRELIELKKYKETEEKAKLKAKIKLTRAEKKELEREIKQGVINKEKIDILKKEIANIKK